MHLDLHTRTHARTHTHTHNLVRVVTDSNFISCKFRCAQEKFTQFIHYYDMTTLL